MTLVAAVRGSMGRVVQKPEGNVNSPEMATAAIRGVIDWLEEQVTFEQSYGGPTMMETKHKIYMLGLLQEQVKK